MQTTLIQCVRRTQSRWRKIWRSPAILPSVRIASGQCCPLGINSSRASVRHEHLVDDEDNAVALVDISDCDLRHIAFVIGHGEVSAAAGHGQRVAFHGLEHGLAAAAHDLLAEGLRIRAGRAQRDRSGFCRALPCSLASIASRLFRAGARTVHALAMVAEVVHGAPYRFTDPARFSFAHGGKDRYPFPVPLRVYDQTIQVLKSAVQNAKLGRQEELAALKRLDDQARLIEHRTSGSTVDALIAEEQSLSHSYGGRSVFGWERPPGDCAAVDSATATQAPARSRARSSEAIGN